jgi:hypothetical protein
MHKLLASLIKSNHVHQAPAASAQENTTHFYILKQMTATEIKFHLPFLVHPVIVRI